MSEPTITEAWQRISVRADKLIEAFRDAQDVNQAGFYSTREEDRRVAYRALAGYIAELEARARYEAAEGMLELAKATLDTIRTMHAIAETRAQDFGRETMAWRAWKDASDPPVVRALYRDVETIRAANEAKYPPKAGAPTRPETPERR